MVCGGDGLPVGVRGNCSFAVGVVVLGAVRFSCGPRFFLVRLSEKRYPFRLPATSQVEMNSRPITAAIYVRVSTLDQNDSMQRTELCAYCERMGWSVVEYAEKRSSVKKRPELDRLLSDARARKFDVVVVFLLDRVARSLKHLLNILGDLKSAGVRFVCLRQGIDTDVNNPVATLTMQILGAVAEFERAIIVERVRAGVKEAQRSGKHCGRPKRIFRRDEVRELRAKGMSLRAIAKQLGVPLTTVADSLRN